LNEGNKNVSNTDKKDPKWIELQKKAAKKLGLIKKPSNTK
jgi:hypothetical protein